MKFSKECQLFLHSKFLHNIALPCHHDKKRFQVRSLAKFYNISRHIVPPHLGSHSSGAARQRRHSEKKTPHIMKVKLYYEINLKIN